MQINTQVEEGEKEALGTKLESRLFLSFLLAYYYHCVSYTSKWILFHAPSSTAFLYFLLVAYFCPSRYRLPLCTRFW